MINLLPKEVYANLHASRHNVLLLRFIFTLLFVFICTIIVAIGTFLLIHNQESVAKSAQSDSEAKIQKYNKAEKDAKEFADNLKVAKQILAKNVSYTTILANIAQVLPDNAIVDTLSLSPAMVNKPTQLLVHTKSYDEGASIKDVFNASGIAKNASLVGINYESQPSDVAGQPPVPASDFPYAVSLSVTFTDKILEKKEAVK